MGGSDDSRAHPFDGVDLRAEPERYRIGRGEYGVFHAEPYKGELLPLWRFKTPAIARESAEAILERYRGYLADDDFVGMDLARKYLQMGYTRARRYAKYPGGRKYDDDGQVRDVDTLDDDKQAAADIFHAAWRQVADDPEYQARKKAFQRDRRRRRARDD